MRIVSLYIQRDMSEVTLYCGKCDPDIALHQDQYTVNSDNLPALVVLEKYLYLVEDKI